MQDLSHSSMGAVPEGHRILGRTGLVIREVGLGGWPLGGEAWNLGLPIGWSGVDASDAVAVVREAIDSGIHVIDTADVYGMGRSERTIGAVITATERESLVLCSKTGYFRGCAAHAYFPLHLRHQLEMTLSNLGTEYVDVYSFHNLDFGPNDTYLDDALALMHRFREEGKIRFIGMRGPHRHALDRVGGAIDDKFARYRRLVERVDPDVIQIRYNMLTPVPSPERDPFAVAAAGNRGVFVTKPLGQGLLVNKYSPEQPPHFDSTDHRSRKAWFQAPALRVLQTRLRRLGNRFGDTPVAFVRVAIQYALTQSSSAIALVGATRRTHVQAAVAAIGRPLTTDDVAYVREVMFEFGAEAGGFFLETNRSEVEGEHNEQHGH